MTRGLLIPACATAGMTEVAAAVAFWLSDANRAAQKIRHRRGIADCRLPIADCRLPILRQRRSRSSYSGWFVSCLFLCVMPMASATDKSHYTHKISNIKFFCSFFIPSFPPLHRRGGNDGDITNGGVIVPVGGCGVFGGFWRRRLLLLVRFCRPRMPKLSPHGSIIIFLVP